MKRVFWFIIGWFISLFATHNFGWKPTLKTGLLLLGMWIFVTSVEFLKQLEKDFAKGEN